MKVVDTLYIALGIDPSKMDKGLATAQTKLATGMKSIVNSVFAPLMAGLGGLSIGALFNSIKNELSQMNSLSKSFKVNIEDMTAWSRAVVMSGGNVESFQSSLSFLNQNLTRMALTGHSRVKPFFEAMGLDAQELAKKPVLNALEDISVAIEGMDKRTSMNLLRGMGFDEGTIKLLQSGTKNVKELIARQKELGVYTAKDAEALTKMNKGFKEIITVLKTAVIPLFTSIISIFSKVTQYIVNGVVYIRKNIDILRGALLLLALVFRKELLSAVIQFGKAFLMNPFGQFIAGLTIVLLLLEDLWVYANNGKTAFGRYWKQLGKPDEVLNGFKKVGKAVEGFFKFLGNLFNGKLVTQDAKFLFLIVGAIALLVAAIGWIPIAIATATAVIAYYWDEIEKFITDVLSSFKAVGKMLIDFFRIGGVLHQGLSQIWDSLNATFDEAIEAVKNKWNEFTEFIRNGWEKIKSFFSFDIKLPSFSDVNLPKVNVASQIDSVKNVFGSVKNTAFSAFDGIKSVASSAWDSVVGIVDTDKINKSIGTIKSTVSDSFDYAKYYAELSVRTIESYVADAFYGVLDTVRGVTGTINEVIESAGNVIVGIYNYVVDAITSDWNNLVADFGKGSSAIGSFLANAAKTAMNAWKRFIDWLEQKWNKLKEFLPSFEKMASGLPKVDVAPRMAVAGAGGGSVSTTTQMDNSVHNNNFHLYTPEATNTAMRQSGFVSQIDTGVRR